MKPSKRQVPGRNGGTLSPQMKGQPSHNPKGRPKGTKNRATVLKEFLTATVKARNTITNKDELLTVEQQMALSIIEQVIMKGNVQAYNSIMDNVYGKLKDVVEVDNTHSISPLEILKQLDERSKNRN